MTFSEVNRDSFIRSRFVGTILDAVTIFALTVLSERVDLGPIRKKAVQL